MFPTTRRHANYSHPNPLTSPPGDMLAVAVTKPVEVSGAVETLDQALGGRISALVKAGEIRGGLGQVTVLHTEGAGVRAVRVAVVGLGAADKAGPDQARQAAGAVARSALQRARPAARDRGRVVPVLRGRGQPVPGRRRVDGRLQLRRLPHPGRNDRPKPLQSLAIVGGERAAIKRAQAVSDAVGRARDLQNTPARDMRPGRAGRAGPRDRPGAPHGHHPGARPALDRGQRHGRVRRRRPGQRRPRPADHDALPAGAAAPPRGGAGPRRQGRHLRLRRAVDEAGAQHGRDEVRHVGGRCGAGGDRRHRRARPAGERDHGGRRDREHGRLQLGDGGRRRQGQERQDDRDQQHRCRGPVGAGRLSTPRAHARRDPRGRPGHAHGRGGGRPGRLPRGRDRARPGLDRPAGRGR